MPNFDLEAFRDEAEIRDVVNRYAYALDRKDWDDLHHVFAADASVEFKGIGRFQGIAEIIKIVESALDFALATQHLIGNVSIKIDGNTASSECYLQALHVGKGDFAGKTMTVWGKYTDRLERRPEGWRIVHRELTGIHAEGDIGMPIIERSS